MRCETCGQGPASPLLNIPFDARRYSRPIPRVLADPAGQCIRRRQRRCDRPWRRRSTQPSNAQISPMGEDRSGSGARTLLVLLCAISGPWTGRRRTAAFDPIRTFDSRSSNVRKRSVSILHSSRAKARLSGVARMEPVDGDQTCLAVLASDIVVERRFTTTLLGFPPDDGRSRTLNKLPRNPGG